MPSPRERNRNNVRAGIFMTLTLAVAMAVVFLLGDVRSWFGPADHSYTAEFPVTAGVKNIKGGAEVRVGGFPVGKVTDVRLVTGGDVAGADDPTLFIDFEMEDRVTLYDDGLVRIASALVGESAWIDITSLGGGGGSTVVPDGGTIVGFSGAGQLLEAIFGPKAPEMAENAERFMRFAGDIEKLYGEDVKPIFDNVNALTGDVRHDWPQWAQRVSEVMEWTATLTADIDVAVDEGTGLLRDGREVVAENRPNIERFVEQANAIGDDVKASTEDVRDLAQRINEASPEVLARVERVLDTGQNALDEAVTLLETTRQDYEGWSNDVGMLLGNAMLTSQQLKLASAEIRRSPWKLLYRPTADELEHELLYEAARSYALAVTELRAATDTTERLLERHGERLQQDPGAFSKVRDRLNESLERYEGAQRRLLQILNETP